MASKQKQRTKGNTRPSSSGRAADLLARDGSGAGAGPSGFIGFGTMSGDLGYVPAAQSLSLESDQDSSLEADFRMALRKLTKRDVVTKLKAIQEFGTLCKEKNSEAVTGTLPHWPRIYSRLATDHDKRVREATQQAFEQLILRVRRNLAPQLRSLMGTWLLSQCDTYAPAALSARAAFNSAFPAAKQGEAMAFCKNELVKYLEDNLFKETAASLSDPRSYTSDEQEEKYLRIQTSSLLALGEFVTLLPEKDRASVETKLTSILSEAKLWKLAKSQSPQLRSAMYSLQGSLIKSAPSIAEPHLARMSAMLLGSLDESEPLAVQSLWESVLLVMSTFPECWGHLNIRKAVFPKLWSMLRQGGSGNATVIYPSLLPLISHIPEDLIGTGLGFYEEFFGNILQGLTCTSAQQSTSEYGAIVKAYMECLRYAISQSVTSEASDNSTSVQTYLIQSQLIPLLEQSITEDASHLATTSLYHQTAQLLSHLGKQLDKTAEAANVLEMIWTSLSHMCTKHVLNDLTESSSKPLEKISMLLTQLQSPDKSLRQKALKTRSVSFSDDHENSSSPTEVQPRISATQHQELISLVRKLVRNCYAPARRGSVLHLKFLVGILESFQQAKVFEELLRGHGDRSDFDPESKERELDEKEIGEMNKKLQNAEDDVKDINSELQSRELVSPQTLSEIKDDSSILRRCFDDVFLPWTQSEERKHTVGDSSQKNNQEVLGHVVNLVAALFGCCDVVQRTLMLDEFCQKTSEPQTLYLLIKKLLESAIHTHTKTWLRSAVFGDKLLTLADMLCCKALEGNVEGSTPSQSWALIDLGLSVEENEEPVVDPGYAEQILRKFTDTLLRSKVKVDGNEQRVHGCISFICEVATNFFSAVKGCLLISSAEDLLLALFQLTCREADNFPEWLQDKIQHAWTTGANSLIKQTGGFLRDDGFLCKAASWIKSCLNQGPHTIHSIGLLAKPATVLVELVSSIFPPNGESPGTAESLLLLLLPTEREWDGATEMANQWMASLFLDQNLTFTDLPAMTSPDPVTMPTRLALALLVAALTKPSETLVSPEIENKHFPEVEEVFEQNVEDRDRCVAITTSPWSYDVIATGVQKLIYTLQWCKATMGIAATSDQVLHQNLSIKVPPYCFEVVAAVNSTLDGLWKSFNIDDWRQLVRDVLQMSLESGGLWSSTLSYILCCFAKHQGTQHRLDVLHMAQGSDRFAVLSLPLVQTLEAIVEFLSQDQVLEILEINTAKLLSSNADMVLNIDGGLGSLSIITAVARQPQSLDSISQSHVIAGCVQQLMQWRENQPDVFLFSSNLQDATIFDKTLLNIKMMQLMRLAIDRLPEALNEATWDFVLCSCSNWIQTCSQNVEFALSSPLITAFCCMAFDLLTCAATLLGSPTSNPFLPPNLCTEWQELFSDASFSLMLPMFVTIVDSTNIESLTISQHHLIQSASEAVRHMPAEQLKKHTLQPKSGLRPSHNAVHILFECLCPMLWTSERSSKLAAFQILEKVVEEIARDDEKDLREESNSDKREEESSIPPPAPLKDVLDSASAYIDVILSDVQIGECLSLDPASAGYHQSLSCVLSYLLVWRLYLRIFKAASAEVRAKYANYLTQTDGVAALMMNIFRLMPDPPLLSSTGQSPTKGSAPRNMFSAAPTMKAKGVFSSQEEIHHQACALYYSILEDLPAMVRQWWTSQDKKVAPFVDRFTTKYASPLLCSQEIRDVQTATQTFENMTVKARSMTREVIATYTMQDLTMDLTVRIPANHPLGIITVDSERKVGVGTTQWRNWTLQLTTFLRNQNGSIMDGLTLWKRNVDKRFEGVEDCMICFSVIHGSNCSLPKLQCKTCKKRYHSACLYKWFSTSNQSSCPLCRSPF